MPWFCTDSCGNRDTRTTIKMKDRCGRVYADDNEESIYKSKAKVVTKLIIYSNTDAYIGLCFLCFDCAEKL